LDKTPKAAPETSQEVDKHQEQERLEQETWYLEDSAIETRLGFNFS
jgi:hypothetical protein